MRIYKTALGIETGDIVNTSYGTGPYHVFDISHPRHVHRVMSTLFVRINPVISLTLLYAKRPDLANKAWINEISFIDGRYLTAGDEIFVTKPAIRESLPVDMFASYPEADEPWIFQSGVDYTAKVWHCEHCKTDFNNDDRCPQCRKFAIALIVMGKPKMALGLHSH